ncbi:hypothetical protein BJY00DRAFT_324539 [Aspergillus carlsbadensis]|nr:hypothetical protein BJY00DRAFT_324539 [Aspergillus carlsbadensis]
MTQGRLNLPLQYPIIPSSDRTVVATGPSVKNFQESDRVVTHLAANSPEDSAPTFIEIGSGLGQIANGTLARYGVIRATSLVKMPETLGYREAATLTSIATTSSEAKAAKLKGLGASHVAKSLTPDSRGVDIIVDVGGPSTVGQSLKAVRPDGSNVPSIMDALSHLCVARGFLLGMRVQFREIGQAIDEKGIRLVVDEKAFTFKEVKDAYEYMEGQRHFSKIAIDVE